MRRALRRRSGVTLVELLVAALILGFAAPAILGAMHASFAVNGNVERRAVALALAQAAIESSRSACEDNTITQGTVNSSATSVGIQFNTSVTVTNPYYNIAKIEVQTTWTERRNGKDVTESVKLGMAQRTGAAL